MAGQHPAISSTELIVGTLPGRQAGIKNGPKAFQPRSGPRRGAIFVAANWWSGEGISRPINRKPHIGAARAAIAVASRKARWQFAFPAASLLVAHLALARDISDAGSLVSLIGRSSRRRP